MLDKDPLKRITIENILEHSYLRGSLIVLQKLPEADNEDKKEPESISNVTNALGKIFIKKFVDLKISKKDKDLA